MNCLENCQKVIVPTVMVIWNCVSIPTELWQQGTFLAILLSIEDYFKNYVLLTVNVSQSIVNRQVSFVYCLIAGAVCLVNDVIVTSQIVYVGGKN